MSNKIHSTLANYHKIVWITLLKVYKIVRRGTLAEYPKIEYVETIK
jgi:hypothetical protein